MPKFRFCGTPATDETGKRIDISHGGIVAFGIEFHQKTYTEVDDKRVIAKLRGNNHFEEQKNKPKKAEKSEE